MPPFCSCILGLHPMPPFCRAILGHHIMPPFCRAILGLHPMPPFCRAILGLHPMPPFCRAILGHHTMPPFLKSCCLELHCFVNRGYFNIFTASILQWHDIQNLITLKLSRGATFTSMFYDSTAWSLITDLQTPQDYNIIKMNQKS